jgi:hypothetical protein
MPKNVKTIYVKFTKLYNNSTFQNLFSRITVTTGTWIEMKVSHHHYSRIQLMSSSFKYEVKTEA